jgi:cyclic pyranopterin phosphate synthase
MPETGINYVNRKDLMSFEEILRTIHIFAGAGISKLRITGGEPFIRKDIMEFLKEASEITGIKQIHITTNGTYIEDKIETLERIGIKSINLSLDSLDRQRFFEITRRDLFDSVISSYNALKRSGIDLKINMVVMEDRNIEDIYPMLELARKDAVSVRFIEEMPFNGTEGQGNNSFWPMQKILTHIKAKYTIQKIQDPPFSTSANYKIDGFDGNFGIIAAYTRTFCGSCNRIRITPQGSLRTCLYGDGVLNIKDLIRNGSTDNELLNHLKSALSNRNKDGFDAENQRDKKIPISESMSTIGG